MYSYDRPQWDKWRQQGRASQARSPLPHPNTSYQQPPQQQQQQQHYQPRYAIAATAGAAGGGSAIGVPQASPTPGGPGSQASKQVASLVAEAVGHARVSDSVTGLPADLDIDWAELQLGQQLGKGGFGEGTSASPLLLFFYHVCVLALLMKLMSPLFVPVVYVYVCLSVCLCVVFEGMWRGTRVAVKILSRDRLSDRELRDFALEITMMR